MATIIHGSHDEVVEKIKTVLDEYEREHGGATAQLYRQNSASIRIRILDSRFAGKSKGDRHDYVWKFIADPLSEDELEEITMLLLLAPGERSSPFLNAEFDDPIPSKL